MFSSNFVVQVEGGVPGIDGNKSLTLPSYTTRLSVNDLLTATTLDRHYTKC